LESLLNVRRGGEEVQFLGPHSNIPILMVSIWTTQSLIVAYEPVWANWDREECHPN